VQERTHHAESEEEVFFVAGDGAGGWELNKRRVLYACPIYVYHHHGQRHFVAMLMLTHSLFQSSYKV